MAWMFFVKDEFKCPCCGENHIKDSFIDWLDDVREDAGVPFKITSGYRCPTYNISIGGGPEHPRGMAADISCPTSRMRFKILRAAFANGAERVGIGKNFIHLGIDKTLPTEVAWDYYK